MRTLFIAYLLNADNTHRQYLNVEFKICPTESIGIKKFSKRILDARSGKNSSPECPVEQTSGRNLIGLNHRFTNG